MKKKWSYFFTLVTILHIMGSFISLNILWSFETIIGRVIFVGIIFFSLILVFAKKE